MHCLATHLLVLKIQAVNMIHRMWKLTKHTTATDNATLLFCHFRGPDQFSLTKAEACQSEGSVSARCESHVNVSRA